MFERCHSILFLSVPELPHGAIWLTNVGSGIDPAPGNVLLRHIKPAEYLFTPVSQLIRELGLRQDTLRNQASYLANVFSTVMNHLYLQTGTYGDKSNALNSVIRRVCVPDELPASATVAEACSCIVDRGNVHFGCSEEDGQSTSLVFHRYEYARHLLSSQLPFGRWSKVSSSVIESGQQYISEWIRNSTKPLIIKVEVIFEDSLAKRLFSICRIYEGSFWVTYTEYAWLSRFAKLEVIDALLCEGYAPAPVCVPDIGRVAENSFSFGLYCESVWTSLTKSLSGRISTSPLSAWVIGIDRVMCLDKAYKLEKNTSLVVKVLGHGRILIANRTESSVQMPNIAFQHGLVAPMCEPKEIFHRTLPNSASPSQLMQVIMERGVSGFIKQTDSRALDDAIELYDQKVYERAPYRTIIL